MNFYNFFFFQAEDGIRDLYVTGVQTCALPICDGLPGGEGLVRLDPRVVPALLLLEVHHEQVVGEHRPEGRSEERRVGKECRFLWWRESLKEQSVRIIPCITHMLAQSTVIVISH